MPRMLGINFLLSYEKVMVRYTVGRHMFEPRQIFKQSLSNDELKDRTYLKTVPGASTKMI